MSSVDLVYNIWLGVLNYSSMSLSTDISAIQCVLIILNCSSLSLSTDVSAFHWKVYGVLCFPVMFFSILAN
jgi:hypothetical protein